MNAAAWLAMLASTGLACVGGCSEPATPPDPPWLDSRNSAANRCYPSEPLFQPVGAPEYVGVIIPESYFAQLGGREEALARWLGFDAEGAWTPTRSDVELAAADIANVLRAAIQDAGALDPDSRGNSARAELVRTVVAKIVRNFPLYRRQYAGLVVDGRRQVLCRFFLPSEVHFRRWQCQYVTGCDFDEQLWMIRYDVGTKTYEGFEFNR